MGKGKGVVSYWVARVTAGQLIYEVRTVGSHTSWLNERICMSGMTSVGMSSGDNEVKQILKNAGKKLPMETGLTSLCLRLFFFLRKKKYSTFFGNLTLTQVRQIRKKKKKKIYEHVHKSDWGNCKGNVRGPRESVWGNVREGICRRQISSSILR
jgi:hypothetical protein